MARLRNLPARLAPLRTGRAWLDDAPPAKAKATTGQPWKAWYKTRRWKALRLEVLLRDNYTCQRSGVICGGQYPAPDSPVVNHKVPHRGREALFWDADNLETVAKAVHDSAIQREEQTSLHHRGVWD